MTVDLPNPFRRDSSPPPRPSISSMEWGRLYLMSFVLLLVVAFMVYTKKMSGGTETRKDAPGPGQIDFRIRDTAAQGRTTPGEGPEPQEGPRREIPLPPPVGEEAVDFRELAAPFRDGEEKIVKETPEFLRLVSVFLKSVTPQGIAKKIVPGLTADRAFLEPAVHRGRALRVYGRLIQLYTERIEATTTDNIDVVYLGVLQEYPTNRTVCFYLPEKPVDPATGKPVEFHSYRKRGEEFFTDWVEVDGIFLRQYVYPSKLEDERGQTVYARAALLFARTLRTVPKPEFSDPRGSFVFIVAGLALVMIAVVILGGVMSRKYSSGSLRMKMLEIRRRSGGRTEGKPPTPGGSPGSPSAPQASSRGEGIGTGSLVPPPGEGGKPSPDPSGSPDPPPASEGRKDPP